MRPESLTSDPTLLIAGFPSDSSSGVINATARPHVPLPLLPQQVHDLQGLLVAVEADGVAADLLAELLGLLAGELVAVVRLVEEGHDVAAAVLVKVVGRSQRARELARGHDRVGVVDATADISQLNSRRSWLRLDWSRKCLLLRGRLTELLLGSLLGWTRGRSCIVELGLRLGLLLGRARPECLRVTGWWWPPGSAEKVAKETPLADGNSDEKCKN